MMASQTAWPTRWLEIAQHLRPYLSRSCWRESTYDGSASALSTSKWSPQQAGSRPSEQKERGRGQTSSSGRSAHGPVKSVKLRGILGASSDRYGRVDGVLL